jgi:hypothetical protein
MRRIVLLTFVALVIPLVGLTRGTIAQDASAPVLPLAPDPANWCTVEPMPLAEMQAIYESENPAGVATPTAGEPVIAEPEGTPADEATVAEAVELVVRVIACAANGGSGLHDAVFLTDEHLRADLPGLSREEFDAFYTEHPVPLEPEQWLMVYAVRNVRVIADGRIAVNPEIIVPGVGHFRDLLLLERVDGRLLIDHSQEGDGNLYPQG